MEDQSLNQQAPRTPHSQIFNSADNSLFCDDWTLYEKIKELELKAKKGFISILEYLLKRSIYYQVLLSAGKNQYEEVDYNKQLQDMPEDCGLYLLPTLDPLSFKDVLAQGRADILGPSPWRPLQNDWSIQPFIPLSKVEVEHMQESQALKMEDQLRMREEIPQGGDNQAPHQNVINVGGIPAKSKRDRSVKRPTKMVVRELVEQQTEEAVKVVRHWIKILFGESPTINATPDAKLLKYFACTFKATKKNSKVQQQPLADCVRVLTPLSVYFNPKTSTDINDMMVRFRCTSRIDQEHCRSLQALMMQEGLSEINKRVLRVFINRHSPIQTFIEQKKPAKLIITEWNTKPSPPKLEVMLEILKQRKLPEMVLKYEQAHEQVRLLLEQLRR